MLIPSLFPAMPKFRVPSAALIRRGWPRWAVRGFLLGLVIAFACEVIHVTAAGNAHTVVPGRVYRSAQLSPSDLHDLIEKRGVRTVVNLRGCCSLFDWYLDECRTTHDLNISQEDITFSANRLPSPSELRRLIEVLDKSEYPVLFHCRQGSDRTGLASALYMLLYTDADYETARKQCGIRYAHVPFLSTVSMDRFFDMYEEWLKTNSLAHAPEQFRRWALQEYRADPAPARIELIDPVPAIAPGEALTLHVRAHNLSNEAWHFHTGGLTGIHLRYLVFDSSNRLIGLYRTGRVEACVPPGGSIDLPAPLPPFARAGRCRVTIDLSDKQLSFCQLGSDLLELEIVVR
jgi:protein tyrosine phosphatase (PTP) superfamily phosphohydrolase (DUF442 family)